MLILTDGEGKVIGHFLNTVSAYENCWATFQLTPDARLWGLEDLPEQKRILAKDATEWMVVKFERNKVSEVWIRSVGDARGVMFRKHTANKKFTIRFKMFKPVDMKLLLDAIRFPALKRLAGTQLTKYPNIRLPK